MLTISTAVTSSLFVIQAAVVHQMHPHYVKDNHELYSSFVPVLHLVYPKLNVHTRHFKFISMNANIFVGQNNLVQTQIEHKH